MNSAIRMGLLSLIVALGAWTSWAEALVCHFASDHSDLIYRRGERAKFSVVVLSDDGAVPTNGVLTARLDNFGSRKIAEAEWNLASGNEFHIAGQLDEPGFLRLTVSGRNLKTVCWGVGYEPEKIVKGSPSPADFDQFWANAKAKFDREVPKDVTLEKVPERSTAAFDFYRISLSTYGRKVYGYLSVPTDKSKAKYPVRVGVNAAGFGGWTNDMAGEKDAIRAQFSVYPFAPHWKWNELGLKREYDVLNAEYERRYGCGYAQAGIVDGPEKYFFYPVILAIDRAVDYLAARPDADLGHFTYEGTSQGGGFGFYLAGLNHHFTKAAMFVPAITDTMGSLKGRQSGWPSIVERNSATPEAKAAALKWAPYFDGANFASRIQCPVRVAVGFADTTCAPCAVYAAFNEIKVADKQIRHGHGMTHGCHRWFYNELGAWLKADGEPPRRRLLAIGDSITAAFKWQKRTGEVLGRDVRSHCKGGIGIVAMTDGDGLGEKPAGFNPDADDGHRIYRLDAQDVKDVDLVLLMGFYNERARVISARGTAQDVYPARDTFCGRLNYIVRRVREELAKAGNPHARIAMITPHRYGKYSWIDHDGYVDGEQMYSAVREVALANKLIFVDLMHNSGVDRTNWNEWQGGSTPLFAGYLTGDGTPNTGVNKPFASLAAAPDPAKNAGKRITVKGERGSYSSDGKIWKHTNAPAPWNADHLHLNPNGYRKIGEVVADEIIRRF